MTVADVRSRDIGAKLIANSIRALVNIYAPKLFSNEIEFPLFLVQLDDAQLTCACSVDIFKSVVAIASVRSLQVGAGRRAR